MTSPMATGTRSSNIADLERVVRELSIIDNHAHNLYRLEGLKTGDLLSITSEASGDALEDTPTTLAHLRGAKMLRQLLDLPPTSTWHDIVARRAEVLDNMPESYIRKCLHGTQTLLLDDKYEDDDAVDDYTWHNQFTLSECKRIERIEAAASDILEEMHTVGDLRIEEEAYEDSLLQATWQKFQTVYNEHIQASIDDTEVVGFKSVICYETGLDITVDKDWPQALEDAFRAFKGDFLPEAIDSEFRITTKPLNDFLVLRVCELLQQNCCSKPFQFHTGLGDNDESILLSDPAYMQPLIAHYPSVNFVILHSAYPYTRQAGYLASVYKNCYLDLGLVWPELSRDGQEKVIREALEQTPWSKLMWSTDGHYLPETYYLANVQGRVAMEKVMKEYVRDEDLTVDEAIRAVKAIFFENANRLYALGLESPVVSSGKK